MKAGETVTLQVINTWHQTQDYLWLYGRHYPETITIVNRGHVIIGTRFTDRLNTDVNTGSITISNLTVHDTGVFSFFTLNRVLKEAFDLIVHDNAIDVTEVDVLEGNDVTLDPKLGRLKNHQVRWMQGESCVGEPIVVFENNMTSIKESFESLLLLNPCTAELTFIGITKDLSGSYCVRIEDSGFVETTTKFFITVYDPVSVPHITEAQTDITAKTSIETQSAVSGICSARCWVENSFNVILSWHRGSEIIMNTSDPDVSNNLTLTLEIQNESIYSCRAENPVSNKTAALNSRLWCSAHDITGDTGWIIGVIVGVGAPVVMVLVIVAVLHCYRQRNRNSGNNKSSLGMREQPTNNPNLQGSDEPLLLNSRERNYRTRNDE
ncbi:signaling lymphocytic activation molecule-like [Pelmatolapia mariae]|uniref:signaling lymphocytic activation molecule-like n=1 Tax=Pelmatolapia mariae TaxID=158779 RepID=UPI002FE542B6